MRVISNLDRASRLHGSTVITDTAAHTPPTGQFFACLHALTDTVVASMTLDGQAVTALSISAGAEIWGRISSVTLTSGSAAAYNSGL